MNMADPYLEFLASKTRCADSRGLTDIPELADHLFPFQAHSVAFALRSGGAGLFLDTGLGKTECQLEWCRHAQEATNGRSLIMVPLAVAGQTFAVLWVYLGMGFALPVWLCIAFIALSAIERRWQLLARIWASSSASVVFATVLIVAMVLLGLPDGPAFIYFQF